MGRKTQSAETYIEWFACGAFCGYILAVVLINFPEWLGYWDFEHVSVHRYVRRILSVPCVVCCTVFSGVAGAAACHFRNERRDAD